MEYDGIGMRRDSDDVLKRALDFEVVGRRRRGRPNMSGEGRWLNRLKRLD